MAYPFFFPDLAKLGQKKKGGRSGLLYLRRAIVPTKTGGYKGQMSGLFNALPQDSDFPPERDPSIRVFRHISLEIQTVSDNY
jgi:hypothetical protein